MAKRAPARRRPRKAKAGTKGLDPTQCRLEQPEGSAAEAAEAVEKAGGCVVGQYKEPLGSHPALLSILPIDKIEPTPFQRDLSNAHHKRLADVIDKTGRFLDPIIAVVAPGSGFWTPNGRHRLEAMRRLGAKSITALVVPERDGVRGRARAKLNALLASRLATARAWDLKESFQYFWHYKSFLWAGAFLDYWCFRALRSRLEPMKNVAHMLCAHEELLLNWFRAKGEVSTGVVEGLNNKIRVVTRRSYGFRTYEAMEIALYHTLGRLPDPESTHRFC